MTKQEKQAFNILKTGLKKIKDREFGAVHRAPEFAGVILDLADDALKAPDVIYTLGTDAQKVTGEFQLAKRFVEKFITTPCGVSLEVLSVYEDLDKAGKVLYQMQIDSKTATAEMVDWLDENNYSAYTSDQTGITMFFGIQAITGMETAYLLKESEKLKRIK